VLVSCRQGFSWLCFQVGKLELTGVLCFRCYFAFVLRVLGWFDVLNVCIGLMCCFGLVGMTAPGKQWRDLLISPERVSLA